MCPGQFARNSKDNPINNRSGKKSPKIYMDGRYNKIEYSAADDESYPH
jgi:hypothetical protein